MPRRRGPEFATGSRAAVLVAIPILGLLVLGVAAPASASAAAPPAPEYQPAPTLRAPAPTSSANLHPPSATPAGTTAWVELGPKSIVAPAVPNYYGTAPFSGRITAIGINSSNTSNIYIGGALGGVWKSTDGGNTWTPLTDSQQSLAIGAIAFSPDGKTIYAGTGEANPSGDTFSGDGVLKSSDSGRTWTSLGATTFKGSSISGILVNANNPNSMLVSTTSGDCCRGFYADANQSAYGVYLSTDGGTTWSPTLVSHNFLFRFASLSANPTTPNTVYASSFNGTAWESTDGGSTWKTLFHVTAPNCATSSSCRVALATTAVAPNSVFAAASNSTGYLYGIYRDDISAGTITFTEPPSKPPQQQRPVRAGPVSI